MPTIAALPDAETAPEARATLSAVQSSFGLVPNLFRVAANAPAALSGLVALHGALAKGRLRAQARESIALAIAQQNACDYCLSAHTTIGKNVGLSDAEIVAARGGTAAEPHLAAILALAGEIVRQRGAVGPDALARARAAGVSDAEIVEIVANVALYVFTNYLNLIAQTEIDFPIVRASELHAAHE